MLNLTKMPKQSKFEVVHTPVKVTPEHWTFIGQDAEIAYYLIKYEDKLCIVTNGNNSRVFTGTEGECRSFINRGRQQ